MNAAAKDLGMTNTTYTDPCGLKETTVSTADDQVKLAKAVCGTRCSWSIVKTARVTIPVDGTIYNNYDRLVTYNNVIGIKTGSTTPAGGNLLLAATQEVGGENVIVVGAVLGQHQPPISRHGQRGLTNRRLIAAQEALTSRTILKKGDVVGYVDDGLGGRPRSSPRRTSPRWAGPDRPSS